MIVGLIVASLVLVVLVVVATFVAWRRLGGRKLARQARFLVAEETARSAPHQAVVRWRRTLADDLDHTRRCFDLARKTGAPTADLVSLFRRLELGVAQLDQELALLSGEPNPAIVDRSLRTGVGLRADQSLQIAAQLRDAVNRSTSGSNSDTLQELAAETDVRTRGLSAALDELARRGPR